MRFGSVCSGIEAASQAWNPLGWNAEFLSEIELFPCDVLSHHYPHIPNYGDMTKFKEWNLKHGSIDVLMGGTPCQSFSVAGLRKGLDDPRGNLMLTFIAIAASTRARWVAWENVPGVLSINQGRDFGALLGGLAQLGYGFAYRVLDAKYFGVAQRRRRVFVVGFLGDWRCAAAVLFERESLSGNLAPGGKPRKKTTGWPANCAPTLNASFGSKLGQDNQHALGGGGFSYLPKTAKCLITKTRLDAETENLIPIGGYFDVVHGTQDPCTSKTTAFALGRNNGSENVISYGIPGNWIGRKPENGGNSTAPMADTAPCLTKTDRHGVQYGGAVRRLTPTEFERLQGFPDGYTDIKKNGKETPDGPRYKALGNSIAVPVLRWIGERIQAVENIRVSGNY